eukprot:1181247-Prorocentrum_minimum.AAC.5
MRSSSQLSPSYPTSHSHCANKGSHRQEGEVTVRRGNSPSEGGIHRQKGEFAVRRGNSLSEGEIHCQKGEFAVGRGNLPSGGEFSAGRGNSLFQEAGAMQGQMGVRGGSDEGSEGVRGGSDRGQMGDHLLRRHAHALLAGVPLAQWLVASGAPPPGEARARRQRQALSDQRHVGDTIIRENLLIKRHIM